MKNIEHDVLVPKKHDLEKPIDGNVVSTLYPGCRIPPMIAMVVGVHK